MNPELESTSRGIPLLIHRQFIDSCLSCSVCFFATNSSQLFNFLAICCLTFSEESIPHFQFSIQAYLISLSLISPLIRLLLSLGFKLLIISKRAISEFLFSQCFTSTCASAPYNLSSANFPPRTANSAFRTRILWRFHLSFNVCTMLGSRSLSFPLTQMRNNMKQLFPCPHQFPGCLSDLQQNHNPQPVSWSKSPLNIVSTKWELCLLPGAGCCLRPGNVEVSRGPRASYSCWKLMFLVGRLIGVCSLQNLGS